MVHKSRILLRFLFLLLNAGGTNCWTTKQKNNIQTHKLVNMACSTSGFSWECSEFYGGVPFFLGVPECFVMFQCSGVPCSGVLGGTTCR